MLRDVLRLVTGTAGGRLIALVAMPLATRLYSPDDFALLAVYLGVVNIGGAICCLRLDIAIPVAKDDRDAIHLLILALLAACLLSLVTLTAVLVFPQAISKLLGQPSLLPFLWMIPIGIMMLANYSALQLWATRMRRFGVIAITRVTQAVAGVAVMLAMGWAAITPFGLLLGNLLSASAGGVRLLREGLRYDRGILRTVSARGLADTLREYRRFPVYSTPEALANLVGIQVPVIIVAAHAGAEAGYLLLAQMIMAAPMGLLGSSISQVYVSRAPQEMREGRLAPFTFGILRRLAQIGIAPLILAGVLAPFVLPWIFGADWARVGDIVAWMVPWTILQFLASPISMVMWVTSSQRSILALTIFGGALRVGAVLTALPLGAEALVQAFVWASALFYAICLLVFARTAGIELTRRSALGGGMVLGTLSLYSLFLIFV
jgi:O-antigen/teichoic acid export membrane protein